MALAFPNIRPLIRSIAFVHRFVYRASRGRLGSSLAGKPMMLLTTKGRKTGKERTTPLLYHRDGDALVVVASNGGDPRYPAWYLNLRAHPQAHVQVGRLTLRCRARVAGPEERARLWPMLLAEYAGYREYEVRAGRQIPIVVLTPEA